MSEGVRCYFKLPAGNKHRLSAALVAKIADWLETQETPPPHWNWFYDEPHVVVQLPDNVMALQLKLSIIQ